MESLSHGILSISICHKDEPLLIFLTSLSKYNLNVSKKLYNSDSEVGLEREIARDGAQERRHACLGLSIKWAYQRSRRHCRRHQHQ
jgi:hypothetical protein